MTRERSAGVIIFRQAEKGRKFLLLDYGRYWDLPKGHVEKGEDDQTAALRELREETGIDDAELIEGFAREMVYFFRDKKRLVKKEVIFFLAQTQKKKIVLSDEHEDSIWLPVDDAIDKLKYKNAKELMRAAKEFLAA